MAKISIFFLLFVIYIVQNNGKTCIYRTESGKRRSSCCADFEEKDGDCIACSKGYTSHRGQNCIPCTNNTYGERCRHDCSCSVVEICDFVKGCVKTKAKIGIPAHKTSDEKTITWNVRATTDFVHGNVSGLISRQIVAYYTLSLIVAVFGIWLCFFFYTKKTGAHRKTITITQSQSLFVSNNSHFIELEEHLYNAIDDTKMITDQDLQQVQIDMSSDNLDIDSNSLHPSAETKQQETKAETKGKQKRLQLLGK